MASNQEQPQMQKTDLLPRNKVKGVDMCGQNEDCQYIIRSDLGCYMSSTDVHIGRNLTVHDLHPCCQGGDHYLATDVKISSRNPDIDFMLTLTQSTDITFNPPTEFLFARRNLNLDEELGDYFISEKLRDHYLTPEMRKEFFYFPLLNEKKFYIIKGSSYRRVSDLSTDSGAEVYDLHPKCRGGDHYLSALGRFYIIFQSKGVFRETYDLSTYRDGTEYVLHPNYRDALYFWATDLGLFIMKPKDKWGVQFHKLFKLTDDISVPYSVHPDVLNFLPGGMSVTHGPAFGKWKLIKTIGNESKTPITWEQRISRKVGYTKSKSSSMEHNWKVSLSASCETGTLIKAITKCEFSLGAEYGGVQVNTEQQSWEEVTEVEEKVNLTLQPNDKIYAWQYTLGFGEEDVLFCRDIKFSDDPIPPTDHI